MDEQAWLLSTIDDLLTRATTMEERAFYQGLLDLSKEQLKRLDDNTGELDGRIWNPSRWG